MQDYQRAFIEFALHSNVLQFGDFTLKSGRQSPYFFNAGLFHSGAMLARLGEFYARAIIASGASFEVLFGPAYKGIPLVSATAIALAKHGIDAPWCFNRKEAKDHGEKGALVGAPLRGQVLVIDDVITAGTAVGEAAAQIDATGARLAAVAVAVDRQERGAGAQSALQEVADRHAVQTISIVALNDIIHYLRAGEARPGSAPVAALERHRQQYGSDNH